MKSVVVYANKYFCFNYSVYSVPLEGGSRAVYNMGNYSSEDDFYGIVILHGSGIYEWNVLQSHTIVVL